MARVRYLFFLPMKYISDYLKVQETDIGGVCSPVAQPAGFRITIINRERRATIILARDQKIFYNFFFSSNYVRLVFPASSVLTHLSKLHTLFKQLYSSQFLIPCSQDPQVSHRYYLLSKGHFSLGKRYKRYTVNNYSPSIGTLQANALVFFLPALRIKSIV